MSGSSVTAPKGRATRARNDDASGRSFLGPTMQWVLVIAAAIAILAGIFYFGGDIRSDYGGGGSGAPVDAPEVGVATLGI